MKLNDARCKAAKPEIKPYKIFDRNGLYLEVLPNGSKYWRLKYRLNLKERKYAIGIHPLCSLSEARLKSDEARRLIKENIDPSAQRREERQKAMLEATDTFKAVAWNGTKSKARAGASITQVKFCET